MRVFDISMSKYKKVESSFVRSRPYSPARILQSFCETMHLLAAVLTKILAEEKCMQNIEPGRNDLDLLSHCGGGHTTGHVRGPFSPEKLAMSIRALPPALPYPTAEPLTRWFASDHRTAPLPPTKESPSIPPPPLVGARPGGTSYRRC